MKNKGKEACKMTLQQIYVYISMLISIYFVTCQDIINVKLHVRSVFLCYVSHNPLGAAVLLSGQQPTQ